MTQRGLVLFALMSVIWGIPYLFIRIAVAEVSPVTLVFARTAMAAAILLPLALARADLRAVLARWPWLLAFAALEIAIPWVMLGSAEQHISSSLAALLIAGVPLVGVVASILTRGPDRMTRSGFAGLVIGLVGVAAIVGSELQASSTLALLQMGVVVIGYATAPIILARRLDDVSSIGVMALSLTATALLFAPVAAIQWPTSVPSTDALVSIAVLGLVCTAAAFPIFAALISEIGPVRATVITYVNPAVAAILGVAVLNEAFTPGMAIGFALVLIGSLLATRLPTRLRHEPERRDALAPQPSVDPA